MAFDVQGALNAGYSAKEIADYLQSKNRFDVSGMRKQGISDDAILDGYLASLAPKQEEPQTDVPSVSAPVAQAQPVQDAPAAPKRDYGLQLEDPVEGEDYDAPTQAQQALVDSAANAMRSAVPNDIARGLGVGTRSVLQGLGSIAEIPNAVLNAGNSLLGGSSDYFNVNPGKALADALNLPKAQGGAEGVIQSGVEMAAGAVPWLLSGQALTKGASILGQPSVAQNVGKVLAMAPAEQIAGSAAAGMAAEGVKQAGGGEGAQLAAGIAAGLSPAALLSAARVAGRTAGTLGRAADLFTEGGRDRAAGRTLLRAAGGKADDAIDAAQNATEIVPGSAPTLGQVLPGENIATLEKGIASSGQGQALQDRYMSQVAARQAATEDAAIAANARLAAEREAAAANLPAGIDADTAGPIIRSTYNKNYNAARQNTRNAYDAIDPAGRAEFDLRPLYQRNAELIGSSRYAEIPSAVRGILGKMDDDIRNGVKATYADMQAMRTTLSDLAESAARSGDAATARIAGGMKRNLDDYIEANAMQGGFTPQQTARFEAAKAARIRQGEDFEKGANLALSRRGTSLTGQSVSDPSVAGRYFSKGASGAENMRAFKRMANGDVRAEGALKDYVRGLLHAQAFGRDGVLSSAGIAKFRKDYQAALKEIPDLEKEFADLERFVKRQETQTAGLRSVLKKDGDRWTLRRNVDLQGAAGGRFGQAGTGTFTPEELDALSAVQRDAQRAKYAVDVAQVKGSPTAQILATQDLARRFWGEQPTAKTSSWLGSLIGNMAQGAANKLIFSGTNDAVNQRLLSAMLDPQYAAYLMRFAGKEGVKRRENLLDMIARSGIGAANVTARTLLADE